MALQYTAEFLIYLRESPLCTKPPNLPPAEEWMGPPPDNTRTQNNNNTKTTADRRSHDNTLLDQTNRRPGVDRHASRNSANPEDIVLGPPRTAFASATLRNNGGKPFENDKDLKPTDSPSRFNLRNRNGDTPEAERFRDSRNTNFRRRGDDQDSEGWSTVKPRKSFGHEGAERFHGRMGAGGGDRLPNERRPRDRDDREGNRERTHRNFDHHEKDKDHDEAEPRPPRNGLSRGKSEPWFKNEPVEKPPMTARERIDRAKSWRDRDRDNALAEEKPSGRNYERRWERGDHRNEREPEWLDEPAAEKAGGHTEEDFKKFMESMKGTSRSAPAPEEKAPTAAAETAIKAEQPPVTSAPAVEIGPDQFFLKFAPTAGLDVGSPSEPRETPTAKPKTGGGKSSRFTSFFNAPQEDPSRKMQTEPPTPLAGLPFGGPQGPAQAPDSEKEAFQALLMKLQRSNIQASSTPPAAQPFQEPAHPLRDHAPSTSSIASPEPFQQYGGGERREDTRPRLPQGSMSMHDIQAPRPMMQAQQPAARQDQLLQELVGQRHQASSSGSGRMEPNPGRNLSNTEFLMNLMRAQPEPPRTEQQLLMRMPQPQRAAQIPHPQEREPDFPQGGRGPQRQMRGQVPPGFMDDGFHHPEPEGRMQPTQILQRPPPPPGLDQMNPNWLPGGGPMPPQPRSMIPPPGLAGGPGRNHPMGGIFPPNFPPGAFPPPDSMAGPPPPRNMPPPPGFFGGPPPGFIPPPGMPGFPGPSGPEGHGFPFDGRMPPPPGAAQAYRRQ